MILVLASGFLAGNPQAGEALVCADPARLEIGSGQTKTMRILLVNAQNIYGIDLQATFDPAVVEVVDADSKKKGVQMITGDFLKPDFTIRNTVDNEAGILQYVVTQLNPTPPANGKGTLLIIRFRGKASGTSSRFTITSAVIADRHGTKQPVTTQGADLVIVREKSSTSTPSATAIFSRAIPTWSAPTLTQVRSQSTEKPSLTDTPNNLPTMPEASTILDNPAWIPERGPAISDRVLTYVTVGGFSGAVLLSGVSVWLLVAKRRKEKTAKSK